MQTAFAMKGKRRNVFNIKFMGRFKDEEVLKQKPLPPNAVPYDEGGLADVVRKGFLISLPWQIIMFASVVWRYLQVRERMLGEAIRDVPSFFSVLTVDTTDSVLMNTVISLIALIGINILLTVLHELIHAVTVPQGHEVQVWSYLDKGAMFVFFPEPVSRLRFVAVSLAPNIVLAFIPWLILLVAAPLLPGQAYWWIFIQAFLMSVGGIGDYANVWHTLTQVPKGGLVHSYGLNSYWTPPAS